MSLAFTLCPFIFDTVCIIMVPLVINFRNQIMFQFGDWVNKMKPHSVCHLKLQCIVVVGFNIVNDMMSALFSIFPYTFYVNITTEKSNEIS